MEQIKQVYDMLADEESKDIYMQRINYLVTRDSRYMDYVIEKYVQDLRRSKHSLAQDIEEQFGETDVIIWGCGHYIQANPDSWRDVKGLWGFCDRDAGRQRDGFMGLPVISPEVLLQEHLDAVIVIGTSNYYQEIKEELLHGGISLERILFLGNYVTMSSAAQYFEEPFISYGEEEILVDAGAYDLFSTLKLRDICGVRLKKAYVFEPDPVNYAKCCAIVKQKKLSFVEMLPYGTWDMETELSFCQGGGAHSAVSQKGETKIQTIPIDKVVREKVTFIKMDVEGAELKSLMGGCETIRRDKPKLAICIYHKSEDMVQIPLYIKSLVPEYRLYVRHYSNYACETVLYAVL